MTLRNKIGLIVSTLVLLSNPLKGQFINIPDSLLRDDLVSIELKQDTNNYLHLFVQNNTTDTIVLKSTFTLDNPTKLSFILIYKCENAKNDSSEFCDFGYFTQTASEPIVKKFANGFIAILPNRKAKLPFFRAEKKDYSIYLLLQCLIKYNDKWYVTRKKTNRI